MFRQERGMERKGVGRERLRKFYSNQVLTTGKNAACLYFFQKKKTFIDWDIMAFWVSIIMMFNKKQITCNDNLLQNEVHIFPKNMAQNHIMLERRGFRYDEVHTDIVQHDMVHHEDIWQKHNPILGVLQALAELISANK